MNCKYCDKILLYFYKETDEAQSKEIKKHLSSCAECKKDLKILSDVSNHLDGSKAQPPEHLVEAIIRQARKEESLRFNGIGIFNSLRNHWKIAASTAVFAVLMVGLFMPSNMEKVNLNWISGIDSELESLEYSMYEEKDYVLGGYGESVDDFEYEDIDGEMESINENRRLL